MIKDILKRVTAGTLSTITLLTTVPFSGAADGGIMPLADEDNEDVYKRQILRRRRARRNMR